MIRWFLSLHSPTYNYTLSDKKNESRPSKPKKKKKTQSEEENDKTTSVADIERPLTPDVSSAPPGGLPSTPKTDTGAPALPPAFTPSINRTLHKVQNTSFVPEPLPEGLTVAALKARLDGKKKIKYVVFNALTRTRFLKAGQGVPCLLLQKWKALQLLGSLIEVLVCLQPI